MIFFLQIWLSFNKNWLMFREITKISLKNFAKSREFRPNFDFVFRENFVKLEENFAKHEIKMSRNFRKITKTKIFVTTLVLHYKCNNNWLGCQKTWIIKINRPPKKFNYGFDNSNGQKYRF